MRSRILLQTEDTRAVSGWYGGRAALGLPPLDPDEAIARFEAVTASALVRVARRLFAEDALRLAVAGREPLEAPLRLEA